MREQFDSELNRIEKISKYSKKRASNMLDDMATAYISSSEFTHLDKALTAVRTAKKALRTAGHGKDFIDDYFLQRSYLSKTTLRQLTHDSIYLNDSCQIKPVIENIADRETGLPVIDLIIDELKSRPDLLKVLKAGEKSGYYDKSNMQKKFNIQNSALLKNFYNENKNLID